MPGRGAGAGALPAKPGIQNVRRRGRCLSLAAVGAACGALFAALAELLLKTLSVCTFWECADRHTSQNTRPQRTATISAVVQISQLMYTSASLSRCRLASALRRWISKAGAAMLARTENRK